ncbi:MAG: Hydrolase related protein [candidate division Zixibacteria bacterium RBG-1]|mgnify:CR=1 FL=1|nr:MAG: Hydrolase related protein [candidate division Zixibacteria bacterium RBG-1]OGC86377.1 MAG: hypothetical protein A2V73_02655 [candidate division Zixibacteria bacterium RBG_19FT_COMBO_42_43]
MKVAFFQFDPKLGKIDYNLKKIEKSLSRIKNLNLLVLPELCNSGYNFRDTKEAFKFAEEIPHGKSSQFLISLAKQKKCFIVAGINEKDGSTKLTIKGKKLYNSAVLVGPKGYIGTYRKLHLFYKEKDIFEPGNLGLPIFRINGVKVGILVCFDWRFPEAWRILALKGAQIIAHPSNLIVPKLSFRALPGHAIVNRIFIVTSDRVGVERKLKFAGRSMIVDPDGNILAQASADKEELQVAEINPKLANLKQVNSKNHIFKDRRLEIYQEKNLLVK